MKQLYTLIKFGCFLFILQFTAAYAQNYQPIPIQSGFNADVIANGIGPAANSTTHDVDGVLFAFVANNFKSTSSSIPLTYGLPVSGIINSVVTTTPDLSYQLANYSENNCLRLPKINDSGTLIFSRSFKAYSIYILATTGSGTSTMDVIVNFTDSSTQTFTGIYIPDWYGGSNFAIQGIGRIIISNNTLEPNTTNPRLYQIPLQIDPSNNNKQIKSISIKKISTSSSVTNIFAVSAEIYNTCTPPENITSSPTMNNVSINWTAATSSPSGGYDYYLSTTDTAPSVSTIPTGNVSGTTLNLNSLIVGQTYYVWIRSNCGSGTLGDWKKHVFTTGKISALYDKGDIQTSYTTSSSLTTATETPCPGQLSITIPEGYRIKNTTVEYNMTALQNWSTYEQRSFLTSKNNNTTESTIVSGTSSPTGTNNYKRDITIANGLTGTVNFELKAFRTGGGTDCSTEYNKVDNNSWKITTTLELNPLTVNKFQTDVLCKGTSTGSATVNIKGGSGKYIYIWTPTGGTAATATGLSTGTYKVTATDIVTNVSLDETFTINEPPTLAATTSQTVATCTSGGSATVVATGGTVPYTYLWSNGASTATATGLNAGNYSCIITDANGCTVSKNFTILTTNTLVASTSQTDVLCNGGNTGAASVIPSGAAGPFAYVWAPSGGNGDTAHNLAAGNYSVTITANNGCAIVKNFTINQPPAIVITKTGQTDVTCFGGSNGSLSVAVTGGTPDYKYSWAPSGGTAATATGLSAGVYTLTVTDSNGCTKIENYTITQPVALIPSITKTDISCNGGSNGSATVSVTGGTGAYTYLWSPSGGTAATASGLFAGNYIVTIKDANLCQTTASVLIDQPDLLTATIAKTDVTCHNANNGTATVTANGGTGTYTYSWAPSGGTASTATGLAPGTYTAMITDTNGCFITKTVTISEPSQLTAVTSKADVSCKGGFNGTASIVATGGTGNYKYSWSPSGGTAATATGLSAGNYTVTVTDETSCSVTMPVIINEPTNPISLSTSTAGNVTVSSALLSGSASSDGIDQDKGQCLIETGFVYSLTPNPSITDNKINIGDSLGALNASLTNLKGNTTYYVRTYAINSSRFINYGNEINFTTEQYTLRITASAGHKKVYGTVDPVFDYTVSGLMNGDTNAVLTGNLSRDLGENVGTYTINLGTLTASADYNIVFENSTFEITKADQVISWNQDLEFGCDTQNSITLNASSDSGLPITYSLPNTEIAEVSGTVLNIKNSGSTNITASQNGDQNHNPAIAIIKPIEVSQNGLITQQWADVLFFDNNSKDFVAWQWYKNGIAVSGATRQYYNENQALNGTYFVIATNKEGKAIKSCPFEAKGVTITKTLKIYPNPVRPSDKFNLDCNFSEAQLNGSVLNIFDINGKIVQTISNVKIQNQITAPTQAAIYILMLTLPNGEQKTINLLVK